MVKVEDDLVNIGSWVFRPMQFVAYLPMTYCKGQGFRFRLLSFASLWSLLLSGLSLAWNIIFFQKRFEFARLTKTSGLTELFAQALLIHFSSITGISTRFMALVSARQIIEFWKNHVNMLERILIVTTITTRDKKPQIGLLSGPTSHLFERIRKDFRFYAILYFIPALAKLLLYNGSRIVSSLSRSDAGISIESEMHIGTTFWMLMALLHHSFPLWLLYLIRIYRTGFEIVGSIIDAASERIQANAFWTANMNPRIYVGEILWEPGSKKLNHAAALGELDGHVRLCIEMFTLVEEQGKCFNSFFAFRLIIEMLNCIVGLLVFPFFGLLWMSRGISIIVLNLVAPIFVFVLELYLLGSEGTYMTKAALDTLRKLQNLPLHQLSLDQRLRVQLFVMSKWANPPIITAGNFFQIHRGLIPPIVSSLATFLVILVQFKEADGSEQSPPPVTPPSWRNFTTGKPGNSTDLWMPI